LYFGQSTRYLWQSTPYKVKYFEKQRILDLLKSTLSEGTTHQVANQWLGKVSCYLLVTTE